MNPKIKEETFFMKGVAMKKIFFVTVAMVLFATMSFAGPFVPTALELSCAEVVQYDFDGSVVDITFDVVGKPARMYLVINTQLANADKPVDLQNGHMGWHFVSKIDTTVYVSAPFSAETGLGQTTYWDGYGNENNIGVMVKNDEAVAPGTYEYYLWGYDNVNPRTKACEFIPVGFMWEGHFTKIQETGEDGLPLDNPLLAGGISTLGCRMDPDGNQWLPTRTLVKWTLGDDADDIAQVQTCDISAVYPPTPEYSEGQQRLDFGPTQIDPTDFSKMYWIEMNHEAQTGALVKFTFVEGGTAERVEDWGGIGVCECRPHTIK